MGLELIDRDLLGIRETIEYELRDLGERISERARGYLMRRRDRLEEIIYKIERKGGRAEGILGLGWDEVGYIEFLIGGRYCVIINSILSRIDIGVEGRRLEEIISRSRCKICNKRIREVIFGGNFGEKERYKNELFHLVEFQLWGDEGLHIRPIYNPGEDIKYEIDKEMKRGEHGLNNRRWIILVRYRFLKHKYKNDHDLVLREFIKKEAYDTLSIKRIMERYYGNN